MAQEQPADDSGAIRKKALTRLLLAGLVTAAALGALWWLDTSGKSSKPAPAKAPSPIVAAPMTPPPVASVAPVETAAPAPIEPPPPPELAPPTAPVSAPADPGSPKPAKSGTPAPAPRATTPLPAAVPATSPSTVKPAPASPQAERPEAPRAYVVQLGVFADPANAKDLVERLHKAGVRAQMETRVQLGPFQSRQEADKARAELTRMGIKGVVATK